MFFSFIYILLSSRAISLLIRILRRGSPAEGFEIGQTGTDYVRLC